MLLDAVEQDGDTRAAQTRTVLEFTAECLHNAHHLIDEQESRDRNLFLAYSELKGDMEEKGEDMAPPLALLSAGVLPFVPGAMIKSILAAAIVRWLSRRFE